MRQRGGNKDRYVTGKALACYMSVFHPSIFIRKASINSYLFPFAGLKIISANKT